MSQGEKAPTFNAIPHIPQERNLSAEQGESTSEGTLSIKNVDEYRRYAAVLIEANPTLGFIKELDEIKNNPLPQVNQGKNIELLKLNDWIRDINNAARIGDAKLFEKSVKHLIIFLS